MRLYRYTLKVAASWLVPLLLLFLSSACLAGENNGLAAFDGFWEREDKTDRGETVRDVFYQRFSTEPHMESVLSSRHKGIIGEWLGFFKKGIHSLKLEGGAVEIHEGERILERKELLGGGGMRVTFPMYPELKPRDYRRIPEPPEGLRGGEDSFFATFPKSWRNDAGNSFLNISIDRGEVTLTGVKTKRPLPEKLFLYSAIKHADEQRVSLFFVRYPRDPIALQMDVQDLEDAGVAKAVLHYGNMQAEKLGAFRPMRD